MRNTIDAETGLLQPELRKPLPVGPQTVADLVSSYDDANGTRLIGVARSLTCAELEAEVDAAAEVFLALGLLPGDRVAATGPSDVELAVAFLATQRLGLVWVGMNLPLSAAEKAYQIEFTQASLVLADQASAATLRPLLPRYTKLLVLDGPEPDDLPALVRASAGAERPLVDIDPFAPAAIAFTSGTTGRPKGAVHSQHNIMTVSTAGHVLIGSGNWTRGLCRCVALPMTILNVMIYGLVSAMAGGGRLVCFPRNDMKSIASGIVDKGVESLGLATTQMYDLVMQPGLREKPLGNVRFVWGGGNYVAAEIKEAFRRLYGTELVEDFGLTEAPTSIAAGRAGEAAPRGKVGRAHPHLKVRALSDEAIELPPGEIGERQTRVIGPAFTRPCWVIGAMPRRPPKCYAKVGY